MLYCVVAFFLCFFNCSKTNILKLHKNLKCYQIVLCYCVVGFFFLIVPKPTQYNTIKKYNFLYCVIVLLFFSFFKIVPKTIQYNNKVQFLQKTSSFTKLNCVIVLYCVVVFTVFFKIIFKQHNTIEIYNFTNLK